MRDFNYHNAETLEQASEILINKNNSRVIAGGTDLIGTMREQILPHTIENVVSLKTMKELKGVELDQDGLTIGAMTRLSEIEENFSIKVNYPLLAHAAHCVASPQIRNMATLGGNLCQEPRCWYYRYQGNKFNCLRKGGERCNAVVGRNAYHSIFGASRVCRTPCETNCPNHTNIPGYMEWIRAGKTREAAELLFRMNPIASATGRVCPHRCEAGCNRGKFDESVSIRDVERYLGDYTLDHIGEFIRKPEKESGKTVSIIGAGPGGLIAAFHVRKFGHRVVVFDENEHAGGMLYYGIPAYRLPKDILDRYEKALAGIGVEFRMNIKVGRDISLKEIISESDAVLIAIGAWSAQNLGCPGEDAEGVIGGIHFLNKVANHEDQKLGNSVAVIGGGNTAMDAARTARRMGTENVYIIYRRTMEEMPADKFEIEEAGREGVIFKNLAAPVQIIKDGKGAARQIRLQKMKLGLPDASGRRRPVPMENQFETIDVDTVIVAIGQSVNPDGFEELQVNNNNEIQANSGSTSLKGVFAAGDAVIGPKTAVEAIHDARMAAYEMIRFLNDDGQIEQAGFNPEDGTADTNVKSSIAFYESALQSSPRAKADVLPVKERGVYREDNSTIAGEGFLYEAGRCFSCGCVAASPSDLGAALIALGASVTTTKRKIAADEFFAAGVMSSTILEPGEIVVKIAIPAVNPGNRQIYVKYRPRKTIDFPIAGIAVNIDFDGSFIKQAHIAFGAVAPVPKRMYETEQFLEGRELTDETIEAAAGLAVKGCIPLAENRYKINLIYVLLKRALRAIL